MTAAASSTNPLGLTADACAQLHTLFAIASRLQQCVTKCSWRFVGTLCIGVKRIKNLDKSFTWGLKVLVAQC